MYLFCLFQNIIKTETSSLWYTMICFYQLSNLIETWFIIYIYICYYLLPITSCLCLLILIDAIWGKRAKKTDDDDEPVKTTWSIAPIVGNLPVKTADSPAIVHMLETTEYNIQEILEKMSLTDIRTVHALTLKHKLNLGKDTSIKAYSEVVDAFKDVQEQWYGNRMTVIR